MNAAKTTDTKFASRKRVEKLEQRIIDLQRAVESQTTAFIELRERVDPAPAVPMPRPSRSPVVRAARGVTV